MMPLLFAELRRPLYRQLLLANVVLLVVALVLTVLFVSPLRNDVAALKQERAGLDQSVALYRRLAGDIDQLESLREQLPELAKKQRWQGSSAEFSRAVLDAGTRSGVELQKEINASRQRDGVAVYSKVLNFDTDYATLKVFLNEVVALEMLVLPSRLVIKPSGDSLAVTLELSAFVEAGQ